jgi:predicted O-methyltransferase YrrM
MKFFSRVPQFNLPVRSVVELFPGIEKLSAQLGLAHIPRRPDMVMPLAETLVIAAICQWLRPRQVFEIGTYTGATTLAIALNSPDDAKIYTLDLPSGGAGSHDDLIGSAYRNTASDQKIQQLHGESTAFDFRPYHGQTDFVLVDGNHEYEFVSADSANAIKLIRPGGVIIWDDYRWDKKYPECAGVSRCLDELAGKMDIANIAGTRLAVSIQ